MTYILFQLKRLLKNKMTYVPIVLVITTCLSILFLNANRIQTENLGTQIEDNISQNQQLVFKSEQELKSLDSSSEDYQLVEKTLRDAKQIVKEDTEFLKQYRQGNWDFVYDRQIVFLKGLQEKHRRMAQTSADLMESIERDLLMYQTLAKKDYAYEDADFPTKAVPFLLRMTRYVFPVLLPIALVFVLTNLYSSSFEGKVLDKARLIPKNPWQLAMTNIVVGFVYTLVLLLSVVLPVFLVAWLVFGFGELDYPILGYHLNDKSMFFGATKSILLPSVFLHVLSLFFISTLTYLINSLLKSKMTALFMALIVSLGAIVLPVMIVPVQKYAQWLPTTYIKSFEVSTGVLQESINNFKVNAQLGMAVILFWTLLVIIASLIIKSWHGKRLKVI